MGKVWEAVKPYLLPLVFSTAMLGLGWKVIRYTWQWWEENFIAGYLSLQKNSGPFEPDKYGHTPAKQKACNALEIAKALQKKPITVERTLERLKKQLRAARHGTQGDWYATDYQLSLRIGWLVWWRLQSLGCTPFTI